MPQVRNTPVYHAVFRVLRLCRCLSSIFCPYAILSLKDAELGTSNHSSLKIVEEPREPVSPQAMEGTQVTEVTHPCLGPWGRCGGCLCCGGLAHDRVLMPAVDRTSLILRPGRQQAWRVFITGRVPWVRVYNRQIRAASLASRIRVRMEFHPFSFLLIVPDSRRLRQIKLLI